MKKEANSHNSKLNSKGKEIEHNQDKLKKGKGTSRRDIFEYTFIRIAFYAVTAALVFVYFFFWYNALFASHSNANTYTSVIDSQFFITAIYDNNYFGLIVSTLLVALPLLLSYFFHSKDNKAKIITYGTLIFALAIDVFLAYRIVEHVFASKIFMGDTSVLGKSFTLLAGLKQTSLIIK